MHVHVERKDAPHWFQLDRFDSGRLNVLFYPFDGLVWSGQVCLGVPSARDVHYEAKLAPGKCCRRMHARNISDWKNSHKM